MPVPSDLIFPDPTKNADIKQGIDADPDTFELDDVFFARARPAASRVSASPIETPQLAPPPPGV